MGEDPRNMLDWHSSREDVKKKKKTLKIMTDTTFCSSRSICVRSIVKAAVRFVSRARGRRRPWPQKTNDYTERARKKSPCLPSPYISLKAEIPLRALPLIHSHTRPRYVETSKSRRIRRSRRCKWKDAGYSSSKSMNGSS